MADPDHARVAYTLGQWQQLFASEAYFGPYENFWMSVIREYGTINIFFLLGLGRHTPYGLRLNEEAVIQQVMLAIRRRLSVEQQIIELHNVGDESEELEQLYNSAVIRVEIWQNFEQMMADPLHRREYIQAMNYPQQPNGLWLDYLRRDENDIWEGRNVARQAVGDALATMHRRDNTGRCNNCNERGHIAVNCPHERLCRHCHSPDHHESVCPKGGYCRNVGGVPTPLRDDSMPKCFCCGERQKTIVVTVGKKKHKITHVANNCPFKHPASFKPVNKSCDGCRGPMERCWNCGLPACKRRTKGRGPPPFENCEGHKLGPKFRRQPVGAEVVIRGCPIPRFNPQLNSEDYGPVHRLRQADMLRELGIVRASRENRHRQTPLHEQLRWAPLYARFEMMRRFFEQRDRADRAYQDPDQTRMQVERETLLLADMRQLIDSELAPSIAAKIVGGEQSDVGAAHGPADRVQPQQRGEEQLSEVGDEEEEEVPECQICLDHEHGALFCRCPKCSSVVHSNCVVKWSLQQMDNPKSSLWRWVANNNNVGEEQTECPQCKAIYAIDDAIPVGLDVDVRVREEEADLQRAIRESLRQETDEWEEDPNAPGPSNRPPLRRRQ